PHGFEILAGARQCPQWLPHEWIDWYKGLGESIRGKVPAKSRLFLNINSEQACQPRIVHAIDQILLEKPCVIEWTEDVATCATMERASQQIRRWRDRGAMIAVDDIGAGQDGIGRVLAVLPHYAKIDCTILDRSRTTSPTFLRNLREILEGIGCKVIIEGIETEDDLRYVREAGFQLVQGYLYPATQHLAIAERAKENPATLSLSPSFLP
ncbi:MAG: EAL domain-containing protein, partial [Candidatus Igneacidithiobacillus chanchocoensis]